MRRLKVIDLESGNQPIFNEDRSVVIVYNGETYDFKKTRTDLESKGHKFYTHSDTEVIVHLYEEYGIDCVKYLRGMFAFALWDKKQKQLLIARDRVGIKPLYYYHKGQDLLFASELKALLTYTGLKREINLEAFDDYFSYMCVPGSGAIFKDVYKLEPGHIMLCANNTVKISKYWDAADYLDRGEKLSEAQAGEKLMFLMEDAIKTHLISDVPLGVFLSGGLDSGAIVSMASKFGSGRVKTFSMGFSDARYNELDMARLTAQKFNTEHHEHTVSPMPLSELNKIQSFFDEPFADSSAIPTYYVSRYARENVTVALSGDGGDEIFGGYGNYKADKIALALRNLPLGLGQRVLPMLAKMILPGEDSLSGRAQLRKLLSLGAMKPQEAHTFWLACFSREDKARLYSAEIQKIIRPSFVEKYSRMFDGMRGKDFLNKCMCADFKGVLANDYLVKVDRMSMANSLEVRVPFLDHPLVEFSLGLDSRYKVRGLTTKYLLKKVMAQILPPNIIKGRKRGFSIPLRQWFKEDFSRLLNELLSYDAVRKQGYFNAQYIEKLKKEHLTHKRDHTRYLWALVCFELWKREFLAK
jgi:asparagine synthase (glutamine-hydrolysing)